MLRRFVLPALLLSTVSAACAQSTARLVVLYRSNTIPGAANLVLADAGERGHRHLARLGASVVKVEAHERDWAVARLRRQPEVLAVMEDRPVSGHALRVRAAKGVEAQTQMGSGPASRLAWIASDGVDASYRSPAGWAVRAAGGYGANIPGGEAVGPWNTTMGAGVRIAVLDSGMDANHPDLAANTAVNLSEVDQAALPSVCDDGSPADQQGHGTWAASLAAGALGGGAVAGVAPQATLLNIKVLERMPAASGSDMTARCEAGQTGGMLSWVLEGINDALAQHADVITMSLGTLVDTATGDGAGWKASFDRVTYAAQQAGTVIVAAAGNDGVDLSSGTLMELPAQARGVLAVVASTNAACAENLKDGATCAAGPVTRPYYSNYGKTLNAVAAPGGSYPAGPQDGVSGWVLGACSAGLTNTQDGLPTAGKSFGCFNLGHTRYVQAMGTSASAPLVAGAAALVKAAHPNWSAAQIVEALRATATNTIYMSEPALNTAAAIVYAAR